MYVKRKDYFEEIDFLDGDNDDNNLLLILLLF